MTEKEFFERLKEDKYSTNPDELVEYRLPVVQYFLTHYTNITISINNNPMLNSNKIIIEYNKDTDFSLLNQAFEDIKKVVESNILSKKGKDETANKNS